MLMYLTIIDSKEGQQKFEFIYNRYKKLMFYIANKILGDTRDSEDTVHDAFLKIIEIIDDIKDVVKCSPSQGHFHLTHSGSIPAGYSPVVM